MAAFGSLRHCRTEPALRTSETGGRGTDRKSARAQEGQRERERDGDAANLERRCTCARVHRVVREYQPAGWQGSREQSPVRRGSPRARVSFVARPFVRPYVRAYPWRGFPCVPAATVAFFSFSFSFPDSIVIAAHVHTYVRSFVRSSVWERVTLCLSARAWHFILEHDTCPREVSIVCSASSSASLHHRSSRSRALIRKIGRAHV